MKSLPSMLNTFGGCMVVMAVIGAAAGSSGGAGFFGVVAVVAFASAWLAPRGTSNPPARPGEAHANGETRSCGYCTSEIPASALRCPQCSGEFHHCPRCNQLVAVSTKQKFVGLARGGRTAVAHCLRCGKQVAGPRW
ncbi:hypothetical protein [Nocardioides aromaticivorans]|uniref:hypothetical protein n=1 Tax=Nocardioides aromaticivorans TaxID=200618 RepID=UPI001A90B897|nr:hypothetical protein [Nocardioides aromaticivorans]